MGLLIQNEKSVNPVGLADFSLMTLCGFTTVQQGHVLYDPVEDGIRVDVQGGCGVGVAHEVLDRFDVHTRGDASGTVGMPQHMGRAPFDGDGCLALIADHEGAHDICVLAVRSGTTVAAYREKVIDPIEIPPLQPGYPHDIGCQTEPGAHGHREKAKS